MTTKCPISRELLVNHYLKSLDSVVIFLKFFQQKMFFILFFRVINNSTRNTLHLMMKFTGALPHAMKGTTYLYLGIR